MNAAHVTAKAGIRVTKTTQHLDDLLPYSWINDCFSRVGTNAENLYSICYQSLVESESSPHDAAILREILKNLLATKLPVIVETGPQYATPIAELLVQEHPTKIARKIGTKAAPIRILMRSLLRPRGTTPEAQEVLVEQAIESGRNLKVYDYRRAIPNPPPPARYSNRKPKQLALPFHVTPPLGDDELSAEAEADIFITPDEPSPYKPEDDMYSGQDKEALEFLDNDTRDLEDVRETIRKERQQALINWGSVLEEGARLDGHMLYVADACFPAKKTETDRLATVWKTVVRLEARPYTPQPVGGIEGAIVDQCLLWPLETQLVINWNNRCGFRIRAINLGRVGYRVTAPDRSLTVRAHTKSFWIRIYRERVVATTPHHQSELPKFLSVTRGVDDQWELTRYPDMLAWNQAKKFRGV